MGAMAQAKGRAKRAFLRMAGLVTSHMEIGSKASASQEYNTFMTPTNARLAT